MDATPVPVGRRTAVFDAPLWSVGLRPFFLAAATWAVLALALWVGVLQGAVDLPSRFDPLAWHVHEMLFGFVMAGITGFLLTAVANWTGRKPIAGALLAVLVALWLLGRIACLVSAAMPATLAVVADLALPLALEVVLARELLAAGNRRNYPLLLPLLVLAAANLLMHLQALGVAVPYGLGWRLGVAAVIVLISVIGGRIVPAFTRNWLTARGGGTVPAAGMSDRLTLGVLHAGLFTWAALPEARLAGVLLLAGAALHALRLARWRGMATRAEPLLLVLHVGYLWLVAGSALLGLSVLLPDVPLAAALHALTAGTAGTMMLAVMTRATLGHTGHALHADAATLTSYVLVSLAAALRIVAAWPNAWTAALLMLSAACWIGAFGLFAVHYARCLTGPVAAARG